MRSAQCNEPSLLSVFTLRAFFPTEMYKLRPAFKIEILVAEGEGPTPVLACSGCFTFSVLRFPPLGGAEV